MRISDWSSDVCSSDLTDADALEAFKLCAKLEGILPALEPAHALAHVMRMAPTLPKDHLLVKNMCGRGDKDVRSEEHTPELQSLIRIQYAVFCLKNKNTQLAQHARSTYISSNRY